MKLNLVVLGTLVVGFGPVLSSGVAAGGPARELVLLGQRAVNDRADHDVIPVTGAKGEFKGIKLTVQRAAVDFHRVLVHYGNGTKQEIELRATIPAGGESRMIDLTGSERIINRVEFWYDAKTIRGRRAVVRLFGLR
jgi:hypothetical protein